MSKRWFWESRSRLKRAKFRLEAGVYTQKTALSKARENSKTLLKLSWLGVKNLFWVAVSLFCLWYTEDYVRTNLNLLSPLNDTEKTHHIDQLRLYAQLLTAIFSIYFATIGIILSGGYAKLRTDIIQLLISEQVGSLYSSVLVFSASFCVAATALPTFGINPGYLTFLAGTFFTLATSLTLFPLGQRLFNFFDPIPLVGGELLPKIAKHIEGAVNSKESITLSNHHSKVARVALDQLSYIDGLIKTDLELLETNLPALTDNYTQLLLHYLQVKHEIDQDSYWFPRRRKHTQWFFAGDSATTIALDTSSQLMPEEKLDLSWLETEITERLREHIELALNEQNYDLALRLLGRLSSRISVYAYEFQFEVGMSEIEGIRKLIEATISRETESARTDYKKTIVGISDTLAAMGSHLCLETLRRMITFEKELIAFFAKDQWTTESIQSLPAFLQVDIAFIVEQLEFEIAVEGKRLSKPKYIQQLVIQKLLESYKKTLSRISDFQENQVSDFAQALLKSELPEAATQVVLASLHTYWKLPGRYEEISQLLKRYQAYEHYEDEQYALPRINADDMAKGFAKAREEAVEMLADAKLVGHIFSNEHDDALPDYFGHIYYLLAEECVRALDENQPEKLNKVIRLFVPLSILAADTKFTDPSLQVHDKFRTHLVSAVIQDLASIMGLAILYGEYYSDPSLTDPILDEFFSWVAKTKDQQQYLIRMLRLADLNILSWGASPRNLVRVQWKMAFERRTREDGFGDQMDYDRGKAHSSKLVNKFLNSQADPSHLFFALKVLPKIESVDFKLDYKITDLSDRLSEANDGDNP